MAQKRPCPCPNCNGVLRDPKTVKQHAKKQDEIAAADAARQARFRENNSSLSDRGNDRNSVSLPEEGSERPHKRHRIDGPDFTAEDGHLEVDMNQDGTEAIDYDLPTDGPAFRDDGIISQQLDETGLRERPRNFPYRPDAQATDSESEESEPPGPRNDSESDDEEQDLRARTEAMNYHGQAPIIPPTPEPNIESDSDSEDWETLPTPSRIETVRLAQSFIELIKNATLDNGKMDPAATERLRNPSTEPIDLSDPDLRFSLDLYLACMNASEATYNDVRQAILRQFPDSDVLSYHLAKKQVADITGVVSVLDDDKFR